MRIVESLAAKLRASQYIYAPRLANRLVGLSTIGAQISRFGKPPLRILVDNTVLFHAITHETALISNGKAMWGPHEVDAGYPARIPVRAADKESREYRNTKYLAGIAHLARSGVLTLMTSGELWVERLCLPAGRFSGYGYFDLDLFQDIEMPLVDDIPNMHGVPTWMGVPSIKEQRSKRLASSTDPLYQSLAQQLGPKNSQDAWHVRTAEANQMFCFLTMDFKLLKGLNARRNSEPIRSLKTKVMTPEELGKYLRIAPVDPAILSHQNASFPVRHDLHWPNSARQKPAKRPDPE